MVPENSVREHLPDIAARLQGEAKVFRAEPGHWERGPVASRGPAEQRLESGSGQEQSACSPGCEVDARDKDGKTPVQCAVERGNAEAAGLLRKHGAKE